MDLDATHFTGWDVKAGKLVSGQTPVTYAAVLKKLKILKPFSWLLERDFWLPWLNHWGPVGSIANSMVFFFILKSPGIFTGHIHGWGMTKNDKLSFTTGLIGMFAVPVCMVIMNGLGMSAICY